DALAGAGPDALHVGDRLRIGHAGRCTESRDTEHERAEEAMHDISPCRSGQAIVQTPAGRVKVKPCHSERCRSAHRSRLLDAPGMKRQTAGMAKPKDLMAVDVHTEDLGD